MESYEVNTSQFILVFVVLPLIVCVHHILRFFVQCKQYHSKKSRLYLHIRFPILWCDAINASRLHI